MRSKYFKRAEFACRCGCGFDTVDAETLAILDRLRETFGAPVTVTSGCRCPTYNAKVGGAPASQHVRGRAADVVVAGADPHDVYRWLCGAHPDRYGFGSYDTFTHIDTRSGPAARW